MMQIIIAILTYLAVCMYMYMQYACMQLKLIYLHAGRHKNEITTVASTLVGGNYNCKLIMATESPVKNVLILGTAGSGKLTIAENILENIEQEQHIEGCDNHTWVRKDARITSRSGTLKGEACNFFLVDTAGPEHHLNHQTIYTSTLDYLNKHAQGGLSLIILLVRQGCCTPPDLTKLAKIVEKFFTEKSKSITVLIHSGCDGFNEEAKKTILKSLNREVK